MKLEKFEEAELEIVEISAADVICGSCTGDLCMVDCVSDDICGSAADEF